MRLILIALVWVPVVLLAPARAYGLTPKEIMTRVLEHDVWGLSNAEIKASATVKDRGGGTRTLAYKAVSRKHKGHLSQSLVRFFAPPEIAGAGFLQTQNDARDDDRFIYLPELKRSRRVAASQRSGAFMGTDFNFADMDRRDWRTGKLKVGSDTKIAKFDCYQLTVTPTRKDSPYSKIEMSVRKDNFVPLQIKLYDLSKLHLKTLKVFKIKRISGRWFITKCQMTNHKENHSTTLVLQSITPRDDIPADRFTLQSLER